MRRAFMLIALLSIPIAAPASVRADVFEADHEPGEPPGVVADEANNYIGFAAGSYAYEGRYTMDWQANRKRGVSYAAADKAWQLWLGPQLEQYDRNLLVGYITSAGTAPIRRSSSRSPTTTD